jgi:hypothetical protein
VLISAVEAAVQVMDLLIETGHRALREQAGSDLVDRQRVHGDAGTPSSVSQAVSCSDELTYTIRPRPTQACAAEHIGQCSPEVKTVAAARSSAVMFTAAQRASCGR